MQNQPHRQDRHRIRVSHVLLCRGIFYPYCRSYPDEMRLNGSLQCLCRCLPLCHNSDAVSALIEAIQHLCADNMQYAQPISHLTSQKHLFFSRNIEEVLRTDSISTLCHMADDVSPSIALTMRFHFASFFRTILLLLLLLPLVRLLSN